MKRFSIGEKKWGLECKWDAHWKIGKYYTRNVVRRNILAINKDSETNDERGVILVRKVFRFLRFRIRLTSDRMNNLFTIITIGCEGDIVKFGLIIIIFTYK